MNAIPPFLPWVVVILGISIIFAAAATDHHEGSPVLFTAGGVFSVAGLVMRCVPKAMPALRHFYCAPTKDNVSMISSSGGRFLAIDNSSFLKTNRANSVLFLFSFPFRWG